MCSRSFSKNVLLKFYKGEYFLGFLSTIIIGLIVHFQLYSNMLLSPDSLWSSGKYYASNWELSLGRWLWVYIDKVEFGTVFPFWSVLICLIIYGFSNTILFQLFNVKSKIAQSLLSGIVITAPFISMSLQYYCYNNVYALAYFFSILSIYLIKDKNSSILDYILSIISLSLALACYQSFLGLAAIMALCVIILELLNSTTLIFKEFRNIIVKFAVVFTGGVIQYYAILQLLLNIQKISVAAYKGASNISIINSLQAFPERVIQCYKDFYEYFFGTTIVRNAYGAKAYYCILFIILLYMILKAFFLIKEMWKKIFLFLLLTISPIACNIINLIATGTDIYLLTIGGMLLILPLLIIVFFNSGKEEGGLNKICLICLLALMYSFVLQDNTDSKVMLENYKQASSLTNRIWQRVEEHPSYIPGMKIMVAGNPNMNQNYTLPSDYFNEANIYAKWGLFWNTWDGSTNCWRMFIKNELGIEANMCTQEDYLEIASTNAFIQMGEYPALSSVDVIDDIMVIKISNIDNIIFQ